MPRNYQTYEALYGNERNALLQIAKVNHESHGTPLPTNETITVEAHKRASVKWYRQHHPETPAELDEWDRLREERMAEYMDHAPFDSPAARGQLASIVSLEVETARLERKLRDPKMSDKGRDTLLDQLRRLAATHRDLLVAAGLDRKSSEDQKANLSPLEVWETQMSRAHLYRAWRTLRALETLPAITDENSLLQGLRYLLGHDYSVWEQVLLAHRRALGVPMDLEEFRAHVGDY